MPEIITSAAVASVVADRVIAPAVRNTLENLSKPFTKQIGNFARSFIDKAMVDLRIGFQDYLSTSYNRCRHYKTILNPGVPN